MKQVNIIKCASYYFTSLCTTLFQTYILGTWIRSYINHWSSNVHLGPSGRKEFAYAGNDLVHNYNAATILAPVKPPVPAVTPAVVVTACQALGTSMNCCNLQPVQHVSTDKPEERKFKPMTVRIVNGVNVDTNEFIGKEISKIQKVIDVDMGCPLRVALNRSDPVENPNACVSASTYYGKFQQIDDNSLFDEKTLRYLKLEGDYIADVPLLLPSLMVLQLNGSITAGPTLAENMKSTKTFSKTNVKNPGMVMVDNERMVAIIGGFYNATVDQDTTKDKYNNKDTIMGSICAIKFWQSTYGLVRGVNATVGKYSEAVLLINQWSESIEVTQSEFFGQMFSDKTDIMESSPDYRARCIWALVARFVVVHDNFIHHCHLHSLDFDSNTYASIAYNNDGEYLRQEHVFVEEKANNNLIFNNSARHTFSGVSTYALWEGPCYDNKIINNVASHNSIGFQDGGGGSKQNCETFHGGGNYTADKFSCSLQTQRNLWVGNVAYNSSRTGINVFHGC